MHSLTPACLPAVVPVHLKGNNLVKGSGVQTGNTQEAFPFVRLTIANLSQDRNDTSIYWLHFTVAYTFVFYSLWLLRQHYEVRCACYVCRRLSHVLPLQQCPCCTSGPRIAPCALPSSIYDAHGEAQVGHLPMNTELVPEESHTHG